MQKGFEYDDSYYNPTEGGTPNKVFFKKEDALSEMRKLNIHKFKNDNVKRFASYYHQDCDCGRIIEFRDELIDKYGMPKYENKWQSFDEYGLHPMADDEEINKYLKLIDFSFYEIVEVDVDVTSLRSHQIDSILENK
jgi:hypothetical protein